MRIAFDDEEFVLVVEDHAEDGAPHVELFQEAPVAVEDLDAVDIADVDPPSPIDCDGVGGAELAGFAAEAAEAVDEGARRVIFKDGLVEPDAFAEAADHVDVAEPVEGGADVPGLCLEDEARLPLRIEPDDLRLDGGDVVPGFAMPVKDIFV